MRKINAAAGSLTIIALAVGGLSGCVHDGDDDGTDVMYTVTLTNLTNHQPLTPAAVIAHEGGYRAWAEGRSASIGLEQLAESGDPTALIEAADDEPQVLSTVAADGGVPPGGSRTISVEAPAGSDLRLSVATMLAATNDAFTGITAWEVGGFEVGDSAASVVPAWDAGTEANTETPATVPALGGEGYNPQRDSRVERVVIHPGVVTQADGLAESGLDESHRFMGPVARVTVTREQ